MAYESLQALIGTAVTDSEFRKALLNGSRSHAVQNFELTHEELDAVMAIRAETLEQFAGQLDRWIMSERGQVEPPALTLPTRARTSRAKVSSLQDSARRHESVLAPVPAS